MCTADLCIPAGASSSGGNETGEDGSDSQDGGDGDGDDGGEDCVPPQVTPIVPHAPNPMCLSDTPCVTDANCPPGEACNLALDPPGCQTIYCGDAGTPCSNASVCESGMSCDAGVCNPCDICGDECVVDFSDDPTHCGCCDNPAPAGGSCSNGQPICPDGLTNCSGECVNLQVDYENCGSCGNVVGYEAECINGEIECYYSNATLCGNDCVDTDYFDNHCGGCFIECPPNTNGCRQGSCTVLSYTRQSCTDACAEEGMGCDPSGDHEFGVEGNCGSTSDPLNGCDTVPPLTGPCGAFDDCTCDFDWVYCVCTL
jgi:hypothetical protein